MKKKRLWAALLAGLFLICALLPMAASAQEGGETGQEDGAGFDEPAEPGDTEPTDPPEPEPGDDPTPEPGGEDPTPEPGGEDPTPEPGGEDPTPGPGDPTPEPGGEDPTPEPGGEDPTPEPGGEDPTPEPGGDDPTPDPTDEPGENNGTWGGTVEPSGNGGGTSSTGGNTPRPSGGTGGQTIRQPTQITPSASGTPVGPGASSQEEGTGEKQPNYVTFARVNQRNNSMSIVLFYSGASCIGVGSLGLLTLLVFVIRGRRNAHERDGIFEEIQQAESRRPVPARNRAPQRPLSNSQELERRGYTGGMQSLDGYAPQSQPPLHRPDPEALSAPMNGGMYTEEFGPVDAPAQPAQASIYTEEFMLPEDMAAAPQAPLPPQEEPEPLPRPPQRMQPPPAQRERIQPPPAQSAPDSFDTAELLREILHGDGREE